MSNAKIHVLHGEATFISEADDHRTSDLWHNLHHLAKQPERSAIAVRVLDIAKPNRILDAGSGSGAWISALESAGGSVFTTDLRYEVAKDARNHTVSDIRRLPYVDGAFDLIWTGNSLMYCPDLAGAIEELIRCLSPGGWVAIKEEDSAHDFQLPWPNDLEVEIIGAWQQMTSADPERYGDAFTGRKVGPVLSSLGVKNLRVEVFPVVRTYPFDEITRRFIQDAFLTYAAEYKRALSSVDFARMMRFLKDGPASLWSMAGSHIVLQETVVMAQLL